MLSQFPTAKDLAKVDIRRLTRILKESSRGRMGRKHAKRLKEAAKKSFALNKAVGVFALEIRFIVQRMNLLSKQIEALTKQTKNYLKQEQKLLQPIPGVGPVWAPTILAEVLPVFHPEEKTGLGNWWLPPVSTFG